MHKHFNDILNGYINETVKLNKSKKCRKMTINLFKNTLNCYGFEYCLIDIFDIKNIKNKNIIKFIFPENMTILEKNHLKTLLKIHNLFDNQNLNSKLRDNEVPIIHPDCEIKYIKENDSYEIDFKSDSNKNDFLEKYEELVYVNKKEFEKLKNNKEHLNSIKNSDIYQECKEHLGELVIDDFKYKCVILIGLCETYMDIYLMCWDGINIRFISGVTSPTYLKNKIDDKQYNLIRNNILYNSYPKIVLDDDVKKLKPDHIIHLYGIEQFETAYNTELVHDYCTLIDGTSGFTEIEELISFFNEMRIMNNEL